MFIAGLGANQAIATSGIDDDDYQGSISFVNNVNDLYVDSSYIYIHIYIYICICIYIYVYVYLCVCVCVCIVYSITMYHVCVCVLCKMALCNV